MPPTPSQPEYQPSPEVSTNGTNLERAIPTSGDAAPPPSTSHNVIEPVNPMVIDPMATVQTSVAPAASPPPTADDGDLIEKVWVDKVEANIQANKMDPHKEQAEAERQSREYLKQRFGIDVQ